MRITSRCPSAMLTAALAGVLLIGAARVEHGTPVPVPSGPRVDPLRSPIAPYRGPAYGERPSRNEDQRLYNYRTDLRSRQRELEQARRQDTPRILEERRALHQELDRVRRLAR